MAKGDLYDILELPHKASVADVKKAYKRLARKYHPDLNPGDRSAEERFKEISEAYAVLSDPEKKKQYDTFGRVGAGPSGGAAPGGVHFEGFNFDAGMGGPGGFSDLFDTLFTAGGAGRPRGPQRGDDLIFPVTIPLKDAFTGRKITLTVPHTVACSSCKGFGHTTSGAGKPCKKCGGSGKLGLMRGPFSFAQACPACGGTGKDPGDRCVKCGGTGFTETTDKVAVKIPAGVDTGSRVRVKGKGQAGLRGGPPGDLYIETHVEPDPVFEREGPHLKIQAPISYAEAVLGAKIEIPTMTGTARLRIPPGTGCGQVFRLKERGMPSLRGGSPGDLLVEVTVSVPGVVDEKSKDLLREFARLNPENPRSYYNSAQR